MVVFILTIFLGVLVFIALLRFIKIEEEENIDEEGNVERDFNYSIENKQQPFHPVRTDRNISVPITEGNTQCNQHLKSSMAVKISVEPRLSEVQQEKEHHISVNEKVLDLSRSGNDKNRPNDHNNIDIENPGVNIDNKYYNRKAIDNYMSDDVTNGTNSREIIEVKHLNDKHLVENSIDQNMPLIAATVHKHKETTNEKLSKVLNILNMTEKYPGRLSREDLYQITKCSLRKGLPECNQELASYFFLKIGGNDYRAREFCISKVETKPSSTSHANHIGNSRQKDNETADEERKLDTRPRFTYVELTISYSLRHTRKEEKAPNNLPSYYLWPLRNLMKWETKDNGQIRVNEGRVVKECFISVAFIRFGKIKLSKSSLINSVISVYEKTHSIFFHRDSNGSTKHIYLTDGLVDISWYFPMPKSEGQVEDHFQDAVMFLNLHGDACQHESYLPALS
ncbi:hypothetical protein CHS0354_027293 [Potamilus streckersoni]|uniref:Up-regulator of cell proliferation-like domain-containing protein n=1 Tax=Potamilus streckersoni TaxID=2493646 RepID=A0AAE0T906_9BIVA|nr:hypothetical protein CHS0354_027293 [Potamilus streckersoni]